MKKAGYILAIMLIGIMSFAQAQTQSFYSKVKLRNVPETSIDSTTQILVQNSDKIVKRISPSALQTTTPSLQEVTDNGNVTTNKIYASEFRDESSPDSLFVADGNYLAVGDLTNYVKYATFFYPDNTPEGFNIGNTINSEKNGITTSKTFLLMADDGVSNIQTSTAISNGELYNSTVSLNNGGIYLLYQGNDDNLQQFNSIINLGSDRVEIGTSAGSGFAALRTSNVIGAKEFQFPNDNGTICLQENLIAGNQADGIAGVIKFYDIANDAYAELRQTDDTWLFNNGSNGMNLLRFSPDYLRLTKSYDDDDFVHLNMANITKDNFQDFADASGTIPIVDYSNGAPSSSSAPGVVGEMRVVGNYFYWYTGAQWLRVTGSTF